MKTIKIKIAEATPLQIDYLVAREEGLKVEQVIAQVCFIGGERGTPYYGLRYEPTINPAQGQPILEKNLIATSPDPAHNWRANSYMDVTEHYGPTMLIAGLRCYVASRLGDEVEIPEGLK